MFLQQREQMFFPPQFALATAGCLGTTQKTTLDRTYPIEEILIVVNFTVSSQLTLAASPATPDAYDSILQILQHVNLTVNDGKQPRSVVDCNGIALLEYAQFGGGQNDTATMVLAALKQNTTLATGAYRLTYRIPCAETWVGEPLRSRLYLPVHTYPQDPTLTLTFQSAATMYSAGTIATLTAEIVLLRRVPTSASEALLQKTAATNPNGYIDWDLIETPFSIAPGIGTEQRFPLPIPGSYCNLMFRQYLGGATVTRNVIDNTGIGDTVAHGFETEQRWRMETGLIVLKEWRWKHLQIHNELSQRIPYFYITATGIAGPNYPVFDGGYLANTGFRSASSTYLNYLTDGITGDNATELGSVLDCNTPANNGLKMEIVGTPVSVATNASYLYVMGRRLFGDLSKWQKFS